MKTIRRAVVLTAVIGLLAMSGVAMADSDSKEDNDALFSFAADSGPEDAFLIWRITSLEFGEHGFEDFDTLWDSCALEDDGPFEYEFDGESVQLSGYDDAETCGPLRGGNVTEAGHPLNHGAYMSFFNSHFNEILDSLNELDPSYELKGRGCLNSQLAKSNIGKKTNEVPGDIDFISAAVQCQHGKKAVDEQDGPGAESSTKGKAKWGDDKPGKSGNAPGQNK